MKKIFRLCPVRHIISMISASTIILYLTLRGNKQIMCFISDNYIRKYHRAISRFNSHFHVSIAEILYVIVILLTLAYITIQVINICKKTAKRERIYKTFLSLLSAGLSIYAMFCVLWGVYYYADDFMDKAHIERRNISVDELEKVTCYFVDKCNEYGAKVSRDSRGRYNKSKNEIINSSDTVYDNLEKNFECLVSDDIKVKPMFFSRIMSFTEFTGFFFPLTAEANVNIDYPPALLPSTIAHELSHQRGVAKEQESNFVAVLACMSSDNPDYIYSGALLAYIYLGNSLQSVDYSRWLKAYSNLDYNVNQDLAYDSYYWSQFDTPVGEASTTIYEGFLQSYGNELGMKSYGACVDLIVSYYIDNKLI